MRHCKFLIFTDLHHQPGVFPADREKRLLSIIQRAEEENVSFMAQLGDFLHVPQLNGSLAETYLAAPIRNYSGIGNHDTDDEPIENIVRLFHMPDNYYYFDEQGYRFLMLDANYRIANGKEMHYAPRDGRSDSRGYIPERELVWLESSIAEAEGPCVLLSHASLERTDGIVNRDSVWQIIVRANRRKKGSVILCVNGHYHCDYCTIINGVCCLDLNAVSYHWIDNPMSAYSADEEQSGSLISHCLCYREPLSAVITLTGRDKIRIQGHHGAYSAPFTEQEILDLDQRRLSDSRCCVPYIRNYQIDLSEERIEK